MNQTDQRMAALATANKVRLCHAEWKRRLRKRQATVIDVMGDPKADSMRVVDMLLAVPWIGKTRATRLLRHLDISPTARLGTLTYRQRSGLGRQLHR